MIYNGSPTNISRATFDPMTYLVPYATYESLKEKEEASSKVRVAFALIQWCHFNNSQDRGRGGAKLQRVWSGVLKSSHANQHRNMTDNTIMILTIQALILLELIEGCHFSMTGDRSNCHPPLPPPPPPPCPGLQATIMMSL